MEHDDVDFNAKNSIHLLATKGIIIRLVNTHNLLYNNQINWRFFCKYY